MAVPKAAQRLAFMLVWPWLQRQTEPVYATPAPIGAAVGILANRQMRAVFAAAVEGLGLEPTRQTVWRLCWEWWYQRTIHELLICQAHRLTPEWAARYVLPPENPPPESSILVSCHQFNEHIGAARAVSLVKDLGLVSVVNRVSGTEAEAVEPGFLFPQEYPTRAIQRFQTRLFGERLFSPGVAPRKGLELLRHGGSLIVLADFYGEHCGSLLGKSISVADGPIWWAERSGRPLVPFLLSPPNDNERRWRLWCGEPIPTSRAALVSTLEDCIRRVPTSWPYWSGWHAAPPADRPSR